MGAKRLRSGPNEIENARNLFEASVEKRKPDYRYVALAIGENPLKPPIWAVWACIELRDAAMNSAASKVAHTSLAMDEIVRFFAKEQFLRDDQPERRGDPVPELRTAIGAARDALAKNGKSVGQGEAEAGYFALMMRMWEREQEEDAVESHYMLFDWKVTKRIDWIIHSLIAHEEGHPPQVEQAIWMVNAFDQSTDGNK